MRKKWGCVWICVWLYVCGVWGVHTIPIYKPVARDTKPPKTHKKRYGEPHIYYNIYDVLYYVYIYLPTKCMLSEKDNHPANVVVGCDFLGIKV